MKKKIKNDDSFQKFSTKGQIFINSFLYLVPMSTINSKLITFLNRKYQ